MNCNIPDIEKVAKRKKINAEAEKLREKVNKETANVIKLKVAQDTAYWDLKEKLHQLENNHERLQQNMVEVQMQHEAISGQYQDELRLRPETLNKLSSTREICDLLQEYSERLKASLSRCKDDQATLAEAFNKSSQIVREIKDKQSQSEEKNLQINNNLQEKVKLLVEHNEQMIQIFNASKQHLESELKDTQSKLATAQGQKDELFVALNDSSSQLVKKDENIASLRTEIKKYINEFNNQTTEMKSVNSKQEKLLKECTAANESLKKAVQNQEQFTQSICDQNNKLQEKIAILEEEQILSSDKINNLELKLKESKSQCGKLEKNTEELNTNIEELKHEIEEKRTLLEESLIEHQNLKVQNLALEEQKSDIVAELDKATQESNLRSVKIEELSSTIQEFQAKLSELEITLEKNKTDFESRIIEKVKLIEEKDKDLDSKASTINQLMMDLNNGIDARTKLQSNIDKLKKEMETEKNIAKFAKEKEDALLKKVEQMEIAAKEREKELSKQMSTILEMRHEKERLQERLKGMQDTIDNIQKEVTGRIASLPAGQAAELDDNAGMMIPAPPNKRSLPKKILKTTDQPKKLMENTLYDFLSDSDMESELIADRGQLDRHFNAMVRGENVSPLRFKRRVSAPFDGPLSLSQLKQTNPKRTIFKTKHNKAKKSKTEE